MTTPSPDAFQGLNIDPTTQEAFYEGSHMGLARNGSKAETYSRAGAPAAAVTLTSGNAIFAAINLTAGTVVNNITVVTNTTAGSGVTHALFGLYSSAKAKLASSADQVAAQQFAANSEVTLAMASPYTVTADGLFYVAVGITTGTTMPTLTGVAGQAALNALAPQVAFGDTTSITSALSATATVSAGASQIYAYVS